MSSNNGYFTVQFKNDYNAKYRRKILLGTGVSPVILATWEAESGGSWFELTMCKEFWRINL
jgi:hypothetical protein